MFSVNVPVPGAVQRVAADLHPALTPFDDVRQRHTLVVKRLEADGPVAYERVAKRVRRALDGAPTVAARTTGIDAFEDPVTGPAPVVYLGVESPGLSDLHRRLVDELGAVDGLEGADYVPHVTLARGGDAAALDGIRNRELEPVTWTVTELALFDARRGERAGTISLPA